MSCDGGISGTATLPMGSVVFLEGRRCESCWCLRGGSADISDAGFHTAVRQSVRLSPPAPVVPLTSTSSVSRHSAASCSCSAVFLTGRNVRLTARPDPNLWKI